MSAAPRRALEERRRCARCRCRSTPARSRTRPASSSQNAKQRATGSRRCGAKSACEPSRGHDVVLRRSRRSRRASPRRARCRGRARRRGRARPRGAGVERHDLVVLQVQDAVPDAAKSLITLTASISNVLGEFRAVHHPLDVRHRAPVVRHGAGDGEARRGDVRLSTSESLYRSADAALERGVVAWCCTSSRT